MRWPDVRETCPNQWVVIEALDARAVNDRRILDRVAVVELCSDGTSAMQRYRDLHKRYPIREFSFRAFQSGDDGDRRAPVAGHQKKRCGLH